MSGDARYDVKTMTSPLVFTGSGESVTSYEEAYELVTRVQKGLEERGFRWPRRVTGATQPDNATRNCAVNAPSVTRA